jgi:hypothetical protein
LRREASGGGGEEGREKREEGRGRSVDGLARGFFQKGAETHGITDAI